MGKRSPGAFARRKHDAYQSPYEVVPALLPHLTGVKTFAEPCQGEGQLVRHLERHGLRCVYAGDIQTGQDALFWFPGEQRHEPDVIITNPPWTRLLLHPLLNHFMRQRPTWLLFDSDWAMTVQAAPYLRYCVKIVAVGRVQWFPGSPSESKDNVAWFLFDRRHTAGPMFIGRASSDLENEVEAA